MASSGSSGSGQSAPPPGQLPWHEDIEEIVPSQTKRMTWSHSVDDQPEDPVPGAADSGETGDSLQPVADAAKLQGAQKFPRAKKTDASVQDTKLSDKNCNLLEWTSWIASKDTLIPVNKLLWDEDNSHGQIRRLDLKKVIYYQQQLLSTGDPVTHISTYVVDHAGMHFF